MFGFSRDLHEVYELNPTGKNEPVPFGLSSHFTNLDGIDHEAGVFYVPQLLANKVSVFKLTGVGCKK
jgi:hypothetical protein